MTTTQSTIQLLNEALDALVAELNRLGFKIRKDDPYSKHLYGAYVEVFAAGGRGELHFYQGAFNEAAVQRTRRELKPIRDLFEAAGEPLVEDQTGPNALGRLPQYPMSLEMIRNTTAYLRTLTYETARLPVLPPPLKTRHPVLPGDPVIDIERETLVSTAAQLIGEMIDAAPKRPTAEETLAAVTAQGSLLLAVRNDYQLHHGSSAADRTLIPAIDAMLELLGLL